MKLYGVVSGLFLSGILWEYPAVEPGDRRDIFGTRTVRPSISTIHCKTLNNLIRPCYPLPVFAATHPRRSLDSFPKLARLPHPQLLPPAPDIWGSAVEGYPILLLTDHCPRITAYSRSKSFSCNTYGSPRKCCKQKTYGQAKPFRCNTYKKRGGGVPIMVNQESKKGFLSRGVPRIERILDASLLHALFSCRLKFIAGNPPCQRRLPCRLRSEHEREPGDDRIAGKIHVRTVLVARLVITVLGKIFCLLLAPLRGVSRVLDAFIDRKRRHAHARQAEMIGTVVMAGLRARIGPDRKAKVPRRRLHHRIKRRPLRAADFHFFRRPNWRHIVKIQIHHDLSRRHRRMFSQVLRSEQALLLRPHRCDQNRSRRRHRHGAPHARQFQQDSATRRIVIRAVVNLVAWQTRIDPQVVVVRRVQHGFLAEHGTRPVQHRQNISRDEWFQLARNVGLQMDRQLQRLEILHLRALKHLVEI